MRLQGMLLRVFSLLVILAMLFPLAGEKLALADPAAQALPPSLLDMQEKNGIVYFLCANPNLVRRYDMAARTWLADIPVQFSPDLFRVDDALYISSGPDVWRIELDGSGTRHLTTVSSAVLALMVGGDFLFVHFDDRTDYGFSDPAIQSVRKDTGEFIDFKTFRSGSYRLAIVPSLRKMFGTDGDPEAVLYNPDGTLSDQSSVYNLYSTYGKMWVYPDESYIFSESGVIFNPENFRLRANLDIKDTNCHDEWNYRVQIDQVTFYGDQLVMLCQGEIYGYSNAFIRRGMIHPETRPKGIFISGETLFAFSNSQQGLGVETLPLSQLHLNPPGALVEPPGLLFTPDAAEMGQGDILYLLSIKYQSIFRWSASQRRYLESIPLAHGPVQMAYSLANNRLYVSYGSGRITMIKLDESTAEQPFASLPAEAYGLAAAEECLFTADQKWPTYHSVFDASGVMQSRITGNPSTEFIWNETRRRVYFIDFGSSSTPLTWESIGTDCSLSKGVTGAYAYTYLPLIRVNPAGTLVLASGGSLYDGDTLLLKATLPQAAYISDAIWINENLYGLTVYPGKPMLQVWDKNYQLLKSFDLNGQPVRIFPATDGLLVLVNESRGLIIQFFDLDLNPTNNLPQAVFRPNLTSGDHPLDVIFTIESSGGTITDYAWDFGDGATSTVKNPTHQYSLPGSYTVRLVVSGPDGQDGTISAGLIYVNPLAVDFWADLAWGDVPLAVSFTSVPSGGPANSYLWDFGDGATSSEANPKHTYSQPGSYTVTLYAAGPGGEAHKVKENYVTVNPVAAKFNASTSFGAAPLLVRFTNESTGGPFDTYLWDFGDGQTSSEANPTHLYANRGSYTVSLAVSGPYGQGVFTAEAPIQAVYGLYIPAISGPMRYLKPGLYPFNLCTTYTLKYSYTPLGTMTECITSIEVLQDGNMKINYSWKLVKNPQVQGCVNKYTDDGNLNIFMTDNAGSRYDPIQVGSGADGIYCMENGKTYSGWYLFPPARSAYSTFYFHNNDAPILIGPLTIPTLY